MHLLIVEEDPALAEMLARLAAFSGASSTLCYRATEAAERLAIASFDLVLLDFSPARQSSGRLVIRAASARGTRTIVLMTGDPSSVPEELAFHCYAIWEKPDVAKPLRDLLGTLRAVVPV